MTAAPGVRDSTSSLEVSGFIAISTSSSFLRATYPFLLARMVYQVGSPAMFEGKRFLPDTGMPIRKMLRSSTLFADCEPDPLTVATWILKSLTTLFWPVRSPALCTATSDVAIFKSNPQARTLLQLPAARRNMSFGTLDYTCALQGFSP